MRLIRPLYVARLLALLLAAGVFVPASGAEAATRTSSGMSVLRATVITAAAPMLRAAQPVRAAGTSSMRAVPRWRMVARSDSYSE